MSWLEDIRNQPTEKKIRLVWIALGVAAVILIVIWILTSRVRRDLPKDTRLFDTIGQGIHNLKTHSLYNSTVPPQQ